MNKKDIYNQLIDIASKLKIRVSEQNLRVTNVNAKSGLCQVKGEFVFIMEKKLTVSEKAELLSECLKTMPLDDIYVVPAVREFLGR